MEEIGAESYVFAMEEEQWPQPGARVLRAATSLRSVLGEAMCDRADLVLALWDEDVTEAGGGAWELIQMAHRENTPCLWISTRTGTAHWSADSYYGPFDRAELDRLCAGAF